MNNSLVQVVVPSGAAIISSMRRLATLCFLLLIACRAISLAPKATPSPSPVPPSPVTRHSPSPRPSATFSLTLAPKSMPLLTPTAVSSTGIPTISPDTSFSVRFHPDGRLYVGDLVSLEVISPPDLNLEARRVQVAFDAPGEAESAEAVFSNFGIGGRSQATLQWVWDTSGLTASEYALTFSILPEGPTWKERVFLHPRGQVPPPEPYASWASAESECCLVYYIKGTPAERDLPSLLTVMDAQADEVTYQMGANLAEAVTVTILPRVLGHGGFASQGVSISYLDRNYPGGDLATVLHHEMVHILDSRLGGRLRPTIFVEGLAVYLAGGHFKPEPLMPRAAALLPPEPGCAQWTPPGAGTPSTAKAKGCGLDEYIHFASLIDNFYYEQHEIGYLEAGALVAFMVETWGWETFSDFYRDIYPQPDPSEGFHGKGGEQYRAINAALMARFGITLEQLEQRFLQALDQEYLSPANSEDVRLTVAFYETVRRYQQLLDPSAYFLTAWLPDTEQMRQRRIVADYLRRPLQPENLALETMLVEANSYLVDGRYDLAAQTLEAANAVLDAYPSLGVQAFSVHPLSADYLALVEAVQAEGFVAERIHIDGETAQVWASTSGSSISELIYARSQDRWIFVGEMEAQSGGFILHPIFFYGQVHSQLNHVSSGGSQYRSM